MPPWGISSPLAAVSCSGPPAPITAPFDISSAEDPLIRGGPSISADGMPSERLARAVVDPGMSVDASWDGFVTRVDGFLVAIAEPPSDDQADSFDRERLVSSVSRDGCGTHRMQGSDAPHPSSKNS